MSFYYKIDHNLRWDKTAYDRLRQDMTAARIQHDDKILTSIFNYAADIPVLDAALRWAEEHGIAFLVDHEATGCRGYYRRGAGTVALAAHFIDKENPVASVSTLVHEIRHAWQDWQGLHAVSSRYSFVDYYMHVSLLEADAYAFEKKALSEMGALPYEDDRELLAYFIEWFSDTRRPEAYGEILSSAVGRKLGLPDCVSTPPVHVELPHHLTRALPGTLDFSSPAGLQRLGANFARAADNYMKVEDFDKKLMSAGVLTPAYARTFYGQATPVQQKRMDILSTVSMF